MSNNGRWSNYELAILRDKYATNGAKIPDLLATRTEAAIQLQAQNQELRIRSKRCVWNEATELILQRDYPDHGSDIADLIEKGFRQESIKWKAVKLGLRQKKHEWEAKELELLQAEFPTKGTGIAGLEHYSKSVIQSQASKLGLKYDKRWTPERISILKEKYPTCGADIPELLSMGFQKHSIEKMASRQKVRRDRSTIHYTKQVDRWTTEQEELLKKEFPIAGAQIPELLKEYSKAAINEKAKQLGFQVRRGRPAKAIAVAIEQGHE